MKISVIKEWLKKLFGKPYCTWFLLSTTSACTAFVVIFYTTNASFVRNLTDPVYWIGYFLSWIGISLVYLLLGHVTGWLDRLLPWNKDFILRAVLQLLCGVIIPGTVCFLLVVAFSKLLPHGFNVEDYLERDFVVFLSCLTVLNFLHHSIYWHQESRLSKRAWIESEQARDLLSEQYQSLLVRHEALGSEHQKEMRNGDQGNRFYEELSVPIRIMGEERIYFCMHIAAFYLHGEDKNDKRVHVLLCNGKDHLVEEVESLQSLEDLFPLTFRRLTRDYLVNRYAIDKVLKTDAKHYAVHFMLDAISPLSITNDTYKRFFDSEQVTLD